MSKASPSHYLPALDGLRAVSILMVAVSHMITPLVPGGLGVTLFFFISGYIISTLLMREYEQSGRIDIKAFYVRRLLRLTPALYGFVAISILVLWLLAKPIVLPDILSSLFYYANYWDIYHGFTADGGQSPFSITWSLAVEEHFYLLYPLTLMLLLARPSRLIPFLTSAILLVLAWRIYLILGDDIGLTHPDRIYKGTDTRLDSILYGCLFAVLHKQFLTFRLWMSSYVSLLAGLLLLLATLLYRDDLFRETLRYSLQGVAITLIFAPIVLKGGWLTRLFSLPPMTYLGKISYSLYLYHWLVLCFLPPFIAGQSRPVQACAQLLASLVLAHLSYRYIEKLGRLKRGKWVRV